MSNARGFKMNLFFHTKKLYTMKNILIVQRHSQNITGIRERLQTVAPKLLERITFTSSMGEAIENVSKNNYGIVVTGKVFDSHAKGGFVIAQTAKQHNNETKVFLYSVMPENHPSIDGCIFKADGTVQTKEHDTLIAFVQESCEQEES
jgi:DNA-binding NarL/FixJ family response regulator